MRGVRHVPVSPGSVPHFLERFEAVYCKAGKTHTILAAFTAFFLGTCIDQIAFMEGRVQPDRLRARVLLWAEEGIRTGDLPSKADNILEAVLYRGELPRGEVANVLGTSDRHGRRVVAALTKRGVLVSDTPRAPLRLAFPAKLAPRWMPGLFPERSV